MKTENNWKQMWNRGERNFNSQGLATPRPLPAIGIQHPAAHHHQTWKIEVSNTLQRKIIKNNWKKSPVLEIDFSKILQRTTPSEKNTLERYDRGLQEWRLPFH